MAHQISLFVENKPGKMDAVMELITDRQIDTKALSIASAGSFGVLKMLVNEPVKVREMLKEAGMAVALEDVVVIELDDLPKGVKKVTALFTAEGINIENAYGFMAGSKSLFVVETKNGSALKELASAKGIRVLSDAQIYGL